jgi:hypothetical protein
MPQNGAIIPWLLQIPSIHAVLSRSVPMVIPSTAKLLGDSDCANPGASLMKSRESHARTNR